MKKLGRLNIILMACLLIVSGTSTYFFVNYMKKTGTQYQENINVFEFRLRDIKFLIETFDEEPQMDSIITLTKVFSEHMSLVDHGKLKRDHWATYVDIFVGLKRIIQSNQVHSDNNVIEDVNFLYQEILAIIDKLQDKSPYQWYFELTW